MSSCILIPTVYIQIENDYLVQNMLNSRFEFDKVMYLVLYPYFSKITHLCVVVPNLTIEQRDRILLHTRKKMVYARSIGRDNDMIITWHPDYCKNLVLKFKENDIIPWGKGIPQPRFFVQY